MRIHLIVLFVCSTQLSIGQLVTSIDQTPIQLVDDILSGNGITILNVNYTGSDTAIGSFNGSFTNLGLDSGIVMTTGTVLDSVGLYSASQGPFGPNNSGSSGFDNNQPGDPLLTGLAGVDTYNAAVLEFDFIPHGDSIYFNYVFGSEEYPEFVGGGFNDVIGLYLSGPGVSGIQNIAILPGGAGVVSIDNINNGNTNSGPCQNCQYYIENGTGNTSPQDSLPYYIQYDGFTVPLKAAAAVTCGETYHMKIAIADAGDWAYDSGLFIKANSFSSFSDAYISFNLNGADLPSTIDIDSLNTTADSLYTEFYLVNNSLNDIDVNIQRNRLIHEFGWDDNLLLDTVTYNPSGSDLWTSNPSLTIAAGDSVLVRTIVYPNQFEGCSVYEYTVITDCGWEEVTITYSVGGQSCGLSQESVKINNELCVNIYPNPANDKINISIKGSNDNVTSTIYSSFGKLVFRQTFMSDEFEIDVTGLPSGLYIVVISDDNGIVETKRLIVN